MSTFKRIFLLLLTVILLATSMMLPISAAAIDTSDEIMPLWINVSGVILSLYFENGKVVVGVTVTSETGTRYSNGTVTLTRIYGSSSSVSKEWTGLSSSSSVFSFRDNSITAVKRTYQVDFSITATRNGVSETITASKTATYTG